MSTPESLEVTLTRLDGRLGALEVQMVALQEQRQVEQARQRKDSKELNKMLLEICIQLNTQKTQTKITWVLLMLVISGILGVGFMMWGAG